QGLKDTGKLELLPGNEDVRVCFVPSDLRDDENRPVENVHLLMKDILATEGTVDLYVALNNDNVTDTFVLMNIVDIIKSMPGDRIRLKKVITTTNDRDAFVNIIKDDTSDFAITNLVSAIQAFLKYGKVDLFLDYWKNTGLENPLVDSVIYAMRRIDTGISLCNVQEIEDGIVQLRQLMNEDFNGKNDYNTRLFELIAEEIRQDYGPLLEGDKVEFIELVKWSYRKKFYQQTLTFIEAKAPKGIVSKGWYYYLNDEEDKEHVTDLFAKIRSKMRPFEYYKINDLDHYFVKLYHRDMVNTTGKPKAAQRRFAQYRISDLDNTDEESITAYTKLQDREILENLLFSYYWASIVRNNTNHADAKEGEDDRLIVDKSDVGLRLAMIEEAVQYFLDCWEKAEEQNVSDPDVLRIDPFEVKRKSQKMKKDR
ncbi:MAG: hypothetical protein J6D18_00995, partial [Erysipelotrichaceae bacterium]|nr:hypothetical protein [Erysipelotrichaceae bacterium]